MLLLIGASGFRSSCESIARNSVLRRSLSRSCRFSSRNDPSARVRSSAARRSRSATNSTMDWDSMTSSPAFRRASSLMRVRRPCSPEAPARSCSSASASSTAWMMLSRRRRYSRKTCASAKPGPGAGSHASTPPRWQANALAADRFPASRRVRPTTLERHPAAPGRPARPRGAPR